MKRRRESLNGHQTGVFVNKLKGMALETYDKISVRDMDDNEELKANILRVYELLPAVYRLQIRGGKRRSGDSYLESARYLEQCFERCIASECQIPR